MKLQYKTTVWKEVELVGNEMSEETILDILNSFKDINNSLDSLDDIITSVKYLEDTEEFMYPETKSAEVTAELFDDNYMTIWNNSKMCDD